MIAAKHEEIEAIADLEHKKETDSLNCLIATINVVAQKKIDSFRGILRDLEDPEKIMVLSMNIADNCDWRLDLKKGGLLEKDGFHGRAEKLDLGRQKTGRSSKRTLSDFEKLVKDDADSRVALGGL
jgi:hypothetical protein